MKPPPASPFRSAKEREEDRAQKAEALLRAAVRMFNERGFHATSLDDVAASLGVTKPVVYHYLGNKDQVLFECVRRGLMQMRDAVEAVRGGGGSGLDRLRAFLRSYAEVNMADFGMCVIHTDDKFLLPESRTRFRALKREIDTAMRALIGEAIGDGSIAPADVRFTAFTLAGALNWPARWYDAEGALAAPDVAARMVDILTAGLAPRSGR